MPATTSTEITTTDGNITLAQLARLMELALPTVHTHVQLGCPLVHRSAGPGDKSIINLRIWHNWMLERAKTMSGRHPQLASGDARQRVMEATAAKREAEVAKMRGELVPIDAIRPLMEDSLVAFRTRCAGLEDDLREVCGPDIAKQVAERVGDFLNRATEQMCDEADRLSER